MKDGISALQPKWVLHIGNRPQLPEFELGLVRPFEIGEAALVISKTSNHWRKVFSIMAKISFALFDTGCKTWQEYRDTKLLSAHGFEALDFMHYAVDTKHDLFAIVCGFNYANEQIELSQLVASVESDKLLLSQNQKYVVTPYFDWRQLNNQTLKILTRIMEDALKDK